MTAIGKAEPREDVGFDAREGDVLVVNYPEVSVPLAGYGVNCKVGGLMYTRRLLPGDDVAKQYDRIYAFLKARAERDANEKVRAWAEEVRKAKSGRD